MMNANPKESIVDELEEIADLAECAAMATYAFHEYDEHQATSLGVFCRSIAERLRGVHISDRFNVQQAARAN